MQDDQEQQKTTPNEINDGDEKADLIARAMHKRDTVAQNLDVVIEEARVGYTRVRMQVTDYMLNGHGTVHGG
ncbi:MAG: phenylacetic acid degradation protein PaaD, partial [Rhodospirillaceae bacterium]|nr:phenylacetic acid degradation protein PaaD [Rhodospirillaceae bacterium]